MSDRPTARPEARLWDALFPRRGTLVGMVHLLPLPGSPRFGGSIDDMVTRARIDARALVSAGFDALIVENYGDVPFHPARVPPVTVAAMSRAVSEVVDEVDAPVGVNVLRNDAAAALGVAAATGARFVRVNVHVGSMWTDQGLLEGRAHETVRLRARLAPATAILADVHVKHAVPPAGAGLEAGAEDAWARGLSDALLVTGRATGAAAADDAVERVRRAVPDAPILVASGVKAETSADVLRRADGIIVGSSVMHDGRAGRGVDPERARDFVERSRR